MSLDLSVGTTANPKIDTAIEEFFVARMPKQHSIHTLDAYRRDLRVVRCELASVTSQPGESLTISDLKVKNLRLAFAAISNQSAATISRTWSTWNQFFAFLVAEGILEGNPMAAVEKPSVGKSRPKAITGQDSIERLLVVAAKGRKAARDPWPERDVAIIVTLITCGLRLSELLSLQLRSIDGPATERVIGVKGKGDKERTVPLEPEVETVLAEYLASRVERLGKALRPEMFLFVANSGEPLRRGGLQYLVDRLYREAGIRTKVPAGALVHALRHTFATNLARNGASGTELQKLLGHASLATTQRYIDASAREVRAAARSNEAYEAINKLLTPEPE